MTEFDNLKRSYISAIQWGLVAKVEYNKIKRANEDIHELYENLIDSSNQLPTEKTFMKNELELIKEALSEEIDYFYKK